MTETIINPKQAELFQTAKKLFWKFGIKRVTIAEICKEAKVSKMTFYKFYDNKIDLAKSILEQEIKIGRKKHRNIMETDLPFAEKVQQMIQLKFENTTDISPEFVKDIYSHDILELKAFLEKERAEHIQVMLNDFRIAAEADEIRQTIKPAFILYFLNKMNEMVLDEQLMALYDSEQELIMELTNFFFYGLGVGNTDC